MKKVNSLNEIIELNSSFKSAVNLYLSLNRPERVLEYIPTKSSIALINDLLSSVIESKEHSVLLVGPYGKGKSHLLLVVLAILSLSRDKSNKKLIDELVNKIEMVDEGGKDSATIVKKAWKGRRLLPVLISGTSGDLSQSFLYGLNEALKRDGLDNVAPETYYSAAIDRIETWENDYRDTYVLFEKELNKSNKTIADIKVDLKMCDKEALELFSDIHPKITAGSEFNPLVASDVLHLYKDISARLVEEYGYGGIYIVFDEFSKFIESQDGEVVGHNMKLVQDMCELATDSSDADVYFTMVAHKSIKEYGKFLSMDLINSFTGIEGRLIEKFFVTSSKNNYELIKNAIIKTEASLKGLPDYKKTFDESRIEDYYQVPAFRSNFDYDDFESIVYKGCYPLNPIASYLLLNISEKVAQNERTLFTFISNDEPNSMARYIINHTSDMDWSIGADLVYDYFKSLFKREVSNEFIHNVWLSAEHVIDHCVSDDQVKIAKALAVILIVNKEEELPADERHLSMCVSADDPALAIEELVSSNLLYMKSSTGSYAFKSRAGAELKNEIRRQRELKGDYVNYSKALLDIDGRYYVVPRKYNTVHMMTRYFVHEYMKADEFLNIESSNAILDDMPGDGKVISLYDFVGIKQEQINKHVQELRDSRIVVVCPKKGMKIKKQLRDFEIIQELKNNRAFMNENELLSRELPILADDLTSELENIIEETYDDPCTRVLYYDGERVKNAKAGNAESAVNTCCERSYPKTVIVNNEMINRSVISSAQTRKARLNIIQSIISHSDNEEFYSGSNQEATIYRSLFCVTGIIGGKSDKNLKDVLKKINNFVESSGDRKRPLSILVNGLTGHPFGFRRGLIPIYLSYAIAQRREDMIVYFADNEVQISPEIIVNMCEAPDDYALYMSKSDIQKEKYLDKLNKLFEVKENKNLSSNRIKDVILCMQRWFRALPQVSRNMVCLDQYVKDEKTRNAMREIKRSMQIVDFNPFEILFEEYPERFGVESLDAVYKVIDKSKRLFDGYFDWIQDTIVDQIYDIWGGKKKLDLFHTLSEWHENQSGHSKMGLYEGRITNFMTCIEKMDVYSDADVAQKVVKAATDVYLENWVEGALEESIDTLKSLKAQIESIHDGDQSGEMVLSFIGKDGKKVSKLYSHASEGDGSVLRNIIEDALDEYDDLSVNDRVAILLEMIERIIK